jgi:hypothetical protein
MQLVMLATSRALSTSLTHTSRVPSSACCSASPAVTKHSARSCEWAYVSTRACTQSSCLVADVDNCQGVLLVLMLHVLVFAVLYCAMTCRLCGECTTLVEHHDKIRALSHAQRNVSQVCTSMGACMLRHKHKLSGTPILCIAKVQGISGCHSWMRKAQLSPIQMRCLCCTDHLDQALYPQAPLLLKTTQSLMSACAGAGGAW